MALKVTDESRYRILELIEQNSTISQRELAGRLGMSLGKANFCLKALIDKGILKATSFCNSSNKRAYVYVLTPRGINEKARLTVRFLRQKMAEYEALQREIVELTERVRTQHPDGVIEEPALAETGGPVLETPIDGSAGATSRARERGKDVELDK